MKKRGQIIILFAAIIACCSAVFFHAFMVEASERKENLPHTNYQVGKGSSYSFGSDDTLTYFAYGQTSLGNLYIKGELNDGSMYNGVNAFGTNGNITFGYDYNKAYQNTSKDNWNLVNSDWFEDKITIENEQIKTSKNIDNGAMIIQKSSDRLSWENVASVSNFFNDKTSRDSVYTTTEEELKVGTYYRVVVVYTMQKRTKAAWGPLPDEYDKKTFAEVYEVYLCSDKNYISVHNLSNRGRLTLPTTVSNGFYIQKNGSSATVNVQSPKNGLVYAGENATFNDPGEYTITVTTKLNRKYEYKVNVDTGITLKSLDATTYDCGDNKGYKAENKINGSAECCIGSHSQLFIGQNSQKEVVKSTRYGIPSYGVYGSTVEFYVSIGALYSGWNISNDSWGKKEKETVDGVLTGEVGSGAIIIQKSKDGSNWETVEDGRYASGLFTTDFETNYGINGRVLVYTPSGNDVLLGCYYRVLYAYEVKKDKATKNYLEEYIFYLCNADTDAVLFHNLTISDTLEQSLAEVDNSSVDIYKSVESMVSGSCTTTGFRIDTSLNPTAQVSIKKNGIWIGNNLSEIKESGRYDITITSAVGNSEVVTLYVDNELDNTVLYSRYFGDSFIDGVRVFTKNEFPTFEGGPNTKYNINAVSDDYLPLYGTITNTSTGTEILVEASSDAKTGVLTEPGEYEAVLYTNPTFKENVKSGDNRVITIRFNIIAEGTAPGPQVNQESLRRYAQSTIADAYPIYYGLTYSSAYKGDITLAFATWEEARKYALNYEESRVEKQSDGTFRYSGFNVQKNRYEYACDKDDAACYFAEQAIQRLYFDYSDEFTYSTLEDYVIAENENLRVLELNKSVVVFAKGEKQKLTDLDALPIISNKNYLFVIPGKSGTTASGSYDFEFVDDKYGCDSYSVVIIDSSGVEYPIEYNKSVGKQLEDKNCPSGIITIVESTIYGQTAKYSAVYLRSEDNTSKVNIEYELDGKKQNLVVDQKSDGQTIVVDRFTISEIVDALDPYSIVLVTVDGETFAYTSTELPEEVWLLPGLYKVKCVNRLGANFTIDVKVNESNTAKIIFKGVGTEDFSSIVVEYGTRNVALPSTTRYGYDFGGFADENFIPYKDSISLVDFTGAKVLNIVWHPKKYTVTVIDSTTKEYTTEFGKDFVVPEPCVRDGEEFLYWTVNGEKYDAATLSLESEGNVVIKAVMKQNGVDTDTNIDTSNDDNADEEKLEKGKPYFAVAIGLFLGCTIIFLAVVFVYKKRNVIAKNDEVKEE